MRPLNERALERPIRVVLFGGGPTLEPGVKHFVCRLEERPEVDFLAGFCQSESRSVLAVVADLWRRRRFLALPLMLARLLALLSRVLADPRGTFTLNREFSRVSGRIHFVPDIHAKQVLSEVAALKPDLGLIYGSPILKPELFEIPRLGTLGIHHGKLPDYRGKKTTFWAMARGEEVAGVTIQKVNAGLDTGEIVKQAEVVVAGRSVGSVWRDVEALGLDLYVQAVLDVRSGSAVCLPTQGQKGPLYRDPRPRDILRFHWRRLTRRLRGGKSRVPRPTQRA